MKTVLLFLLITVTASLTSCRAKPANAPSSNTQMLNQSGLKFAGFAMKNDIQSALSGEQAIMSSSDALALAHLDVAVTAQQYETAYDDNEILADEKFKNKRLLVSGRVASINKDYKGDGYLTLVGISPLGIQARLTNDELQGAALLKKRQQVQLVCDPDMKVGGFVVLRNCRQFTSYLDQITPAIESINIAFLTGKSALPRRIGTGIAIAYVIGSTVPSNSPCLKGEEKACDGLVKSFETDRKMAQAFQNGYQRLQSKLLFAD